MAKQTLTCYRKGCGEKFDPNENREDSCTFHPGQPVFHDAYKAWSCCNKKTTDFTQFLSTPGCCKSFHSNEKPPEAEKPVVDKSKADEVIVVRPPVQESLPRPPLTTPLTTLKPDISPSVKQQLESLQKTDSSSEQTVDGTPAIGTSCKNGGCKASYEGVQSIDEQCLHHPGVAIFHEGMKFWSCCVKRTSDFNAFLEQAGCSSGKHVWFKKEIVDVDQSSVSMLGTKIEVKLKKAEVGAWKNLHIPKTSVVEATSADKPENNSPSLESRVDAVDLSDL